MVFVARGIRYSGSLALALTIASGSASAAAPSAETALKLAPVQANVDYDRPTEAEIAKCTIKAEAIDGRTGWVVRGPGADMLRQFVDTNNDNVVDQWCYYAAGLEVYRDLDSNFNGKADQYRWLNTAGSRWGIDQDEDGKVDSWKMISAEEACAEAIAALGHRDVNQFKRLLLSSEELKALEIGGSRGQTLQQKLEAAPADFKGLAAKQKTITPQTIWMQLGGSKPGLVPAAGSDGAKDDMLVYENVISMVETDGKPTQVQIGTLIQVGHSWRLIEAPIILDEGQAEMASTGLFFLLPSGNRGAITDASKDGPDQKTQLLLQRLETLDQAAAKGDQAANVAERCDILEQMSESAANPEDRTQWMRSLAETLSGAVQTGSYPEGLERLKSLSEKLGAQEDSADLAAYVKFRYLSAEYNQKLQAGEDFIKVQKKWLASLEQYVSDYPSSPDAAEAMLQLGIAEEFAGEEEGAKKWYGQIVDRFPQSSSSQKAAGAVTRLDCVGKVLQLRGASATANKVVDVSQFRNRVVLVQYWATWCEPCKADLAQIRELQAKYGKDGFEVISISLDSRKADLTSFLKKTPLPWYHIYESGGLDSRLANELGVLTLPTMLILDQKGKVANRNVSISELDREIKGLMR